MRRARWTYAPFALAAWVGLAGVASCLSGDEAPAGGRVEHPPPRAPMPVASAEAAQDASPPPPEGSFTPLDQTIAGDCVLSAGEPPLSRVWSQNVPDRPCKTDAECGDGFCDRNRCAAILTCSARYGQRCINGWPVRAHEDYRRHKDEACDGICLEGRCRSCLSDAECVEDFQTRYPERPFPRGRLECVGRGFGPSSGCVWHWHSRM
jgi:hypothetical protein